MRVLLTGAGGVVGTATLDALQSRGHDAIGVTSADADLTLPDQAERLLDEIKPDAVLHLAARVRGLKGNLRNQGAMYFDNVRINTSLVEAARNHGVAKVVAVGTVSMYPAMVSLPMTEDQLLMGAPHPAELGYAHAKRAMLGQLEAYKDQYGMEYAIALLTNVYGPNDRYNETTGHVVPSLVSKFHRGATTGDDVVVWGNGSATRDFLSSADAAEALCLLLDRGDGAYNVASGTSTTIGEVVELLGKASDYDRDVTWDRSQPTGQDERSYDISRIRSLGWSPAVALETGLRETYRWYADNYDEARR